MPTLQEVVLVAVTDDVPQASAHWPVAVLRAADCPHGVPNAYLCGTVAAVHKVLERFKERPLGLILDVLDASTSASVVEVVPALSNGFTDLAWEGAVAAVCSRHLETVQGMITRHAKNTPDKAALIFEDRRWTFQQLLSRARSLVEHLQAAGIDPNRGTVAVQLAQSDHCITCYLGLYSARYQVHIMDVHAAGRAYRLSVCSSQALICESSCSLEGVDLQTVFIDKLELDPSMPIDKIIVEGELEDTAFIEYTSGSTGRAKSVATKQWRIAHWIRWHEFHFPLLPGNDVVAYNLFFIWYWHISLSQGGTTVVYPPSMNHDVAALMPYFEKHGVHRVNCLTPGLISALLEVQDSLPPCLRQMFSGGEALPMATCREWHRRWPHVDLLNNYALTEAAADMGFCRITPEVAAMDMLYAPISDGIIAWNNELEIMDGELVIHGWNVADGYLPPTESTVFTLSQEKWRNTYRTGDRASWIGGKLFLMGRVDSVVKVRGHRVDLTGLEAQVGKCVAVKDVAMVAWNESVWGIVVSEDLAEVQRHAEQELPQAHLIVWRQWTELPYTKSGKRDRPRIVQMLKEAQADEAAAADAAANLPGGPPQTVEEQTVAAAWAAVLGRVVGREERFQQAGGHSLAAMKLAKRLGLSPAEVFAYPTVSAMAARLVQASGGPVVAPAVESPLGPVAAIGGQAAVVGLAGRFPGAPSVAALWEGLRAGKDMLSSLKAGPGFVPRKGVVPDLGLDCAFWGFPKEVALSMDAAQRTLLELAYEALADAGLNPLAVNGRVGVVVCGGSLPHYAEAALGTRLEECRVERPDEYFALEIGTDKDYLASQIAYKLDLHGPAEVVQTACSSGLVAVVRALQMLRLGLCDYVVCGGASFSPDAPVRKVDGMIWSPDGICRPFAEGANGTVNADGAGLIVLTHLEAARARGQRVYAAVLGGATNNDGARKAGFSAPSHEGQVEVIRAAHADAGISGGDVDYVEAHGTGTPLGDPLEAQALAEALSTDRKIMLGSVKGNIGHMNTVAGTSGFIKATLMLYHQHMVASLHSGQPSQLINWNKTPLTLAQEGGPWKGAVAGVSSFGIGGTNAHVVLGAVQAEPASTPPDSTSPSVEFKAHTFKRDSLVPEQKAKLQQAEASGAFAFKPHRRLAASKAGAAGLEGHVEPSASLFYKTEHERVEVSCLELKEAAVVLDGDVLPSDLPLKSVVATPQCALTAARACGGCLLFVGNSDEAPSLDDESQEELLMRAVSLIASLARAPKDGIEVFFLLKNNLRYAALWGLLRVAAREHPELRLRRLLREEGAPVLLPAMPVELVLRPDGAYAPRLREAPPPAAASKPPVYGRVLVTGGLRGLGFKVAEWLGASGRAGSLVLTGRNAAREDVAEDLAKLRAAVPTEVHLCDVSNWQEVKKIPGDVDLVVHCAGNVKDGLLLHLTPEDARDVLRPKIRGTLHLKERYPDARLLVFSSSSGLFGPVGQATYAAANTFVDALAPSVQWGGWAEVGMAKDLGMAPLPGERFLPVELGLDCLGRVLDGPVDAEPYCVLDAEWRSYRSNAAVFAPDDALLAEIEAPPSQQPSVLGEQLDLADGGVKCWELVLGPAGARWRGSSAFWEVCQQHVVSSTPIFPGTAYVALALAVAKELGMASATLQDVAFLRPLELTSPRVLSIVLSGGASGGDLRFSSRPLQEGQAVLHCTCSLAPAKDLRLEAIQAAGEPESADGLYARFAAAGFHYGPSFRALGVWSSSTEALCDLPSVACPGCPLHPATLDTALHLAAMLHPAGVQGVPQTIRRLRLRTTAAPVRAVARLAQGQLEFQVLDDEGEVVCQLEGLGLAALEVPPALQLKRRAWQTAPPEPRGAWRAVGEEAAKLGLPKLAVDGATAVLACRAESLDDVLRCREEARRLAAREPCVVLALKARFAEAAAQAAAEVGARAILGSEEDLRSYSESLGTSARVARVEDGQILVESTVAAEQPPALSASSTEPYVVTLDPSRAAQGARCRLAPRRQVAAHEVELRTSIWALNFRDVLVAVGAMSSEVAGKSLGIGGECFGEVVSVGSSVSGLAVGDLVMAVPPDGMGSYAKMDARWVSRVPDGMSPEEAVSGTCAYGTAWLGLHWLARIAAGDRVLVHSAAGGVGLAAVHLCLRAGCTVYATASTPEKRALLTSLGAVAVFDSRNVSAFEQGIQAATGGEGVDVVLNSLSGEAIPASLKLLRPFGRFIELGKRDQYEDTRMGLGPFLGGLTYAAAHFDVLMLRHPDRCRKLLEEVWSAMPSLPRLPFTTFSMEELPKALEYFSKGVHVGKVLVTVGDTPVLPALPVAVAGPQKDMVVEALRMSTDATDGLGGMVCLPQLDALDSLDMLAGAKVVVTASAAVSALAKIVCPEATCVQLPRWEPVSGIDDWLKLGGQLVAVEEEHDGDLQEWLVEVMSEMAGPVDMEETFERAGFDSLMLISLARRLTAKVGKAVSVADLYDHPTPRKLLDSFTGGPKPSLSRAKAVCLHGFRSNKDAIALQLAPFISALGSVDWVFINSPRRASGPADPKIPRAEAFEWWGQQDGPYETGWMAPHFDGLAETLPTIERLAPVGAVGFSQGAAVAALLQCAWLALFSAVEPPGMQSRNVPSFHCFDPAEDFAGQCVDVGKYFNAKEVYNHDGGHTIPREEGIVRHFVDFVARQMARTGPVSVE